MDPRANIEEQRTIAQRVIDDPDLSLWAHPDLTSDLERLSELVQALDEWRTNGGFDPYAQGNPYTLDRESRAAHELRTAMETWAAENDTKGPITREASDELLNLSRRVHTTELSESDRAALKARVRELLMPPVDPSEPGAPGNDDDRYEIPRDCLAYDDEGVLEIALHVRHVATLARGQNVELVQPNGNTILIRVTQPDYCEKCGRPIQIDAVHGKPANATGYCVGTVTCIQRPREENEHGTD